MWIFKFVQDNCPPCPPNSVHLDELMCNGFQEMYTYECWYGTLLFKNNNCQTVIRYYPNIQNLFSRFKCPKIELSASSCWFKGKAYAVGKEISVSAIRIYRPGCICREGHDEWIKMGKSCYFIRLSYSLNKQYRFVYIQQW